MRMQIERETEMQCLLVGMSILTVTVQAPHLLQVEMS